MLYSTLNIRSVQQDKVSAQESEQWQTFEALVVAKRGEPFDRADPDTDWKTFLGDNGYDSAATQQIMELIQKVIAPETQAGLCEFFLSSSAFRGEHKSGARVFEYQLRRALLLLPQAASTCARALSPLVLPTSADLDTTHVRAAEKTVAPLLMQAIDSKEAHGWQVAGGESVVLRFPDVLELMHLIDDDKKAGMSQMLLTDMFTKMSLRPAAVHVR